MTTKGLAKRLIATSAVLCAAAFILWQSRLGASFGDRLNQVVSIGNAPEVPCTSGSGPRPLVLLALGQSNAGNHGEGGGFASGPVALISGRKCFLVKDPLPGATGLGGSIWWRLAAELQSSTPGRRVLLSVLALDASTIGEWTRPGSGLRAVLEDQVVSMGSLGLRPDFTLWQQGEADARAGTTSEEYSAKLDQLASILAQVGATGPILLARSTVCRTPPNTEIRKAIESKIALGGRWQKGPDTDVLVGLKYRHDGCHFSATGLEAAATLWGLQLTGMDTGVQREPGN